MVSSAMKAIARSAIGNAVTSKKEIMTEISLLNNIGDEPPRKKWPEPFDYLLFIVGLISAVYLFKTLVGV